ncbi:unnamed protein product [Heligmosomoides polygyrus]|uniref:Uncharacterized protein n=1 Tax=Heligmosomoides polygyrus TaxID=6339 RepID=A0A3P8FGE0_HELPZ|nr:unnamed protein product [Heligmosomoides polygyrus]
MLGTSYGQVPSAPTCDNYMTCQSNLNAALNLTNPQPWFYPEEFRSKVEQFYQKQGAQGLRTVCKAFRQFKGCMGSEYSACMTPSYFVTASVSIYQSYQFVSTFNQMHYTCGGGMQIYLNNDACMSQAWDGASGEQLNACRFKFEQGSDKATSSQDACYMANTYTACFEQQFKEACGLTSRDSQFWGCEYARVNVFTRFPQCEVSCVLPYAGGNIG